MALFASSQPSSTSTGTNLSTHVAQPAHHSIPSNPYQFQPPAPPFSGFQATAPSGFGFGFGFTNTTSPITRGFQARGSSGPKSVGGQAPVKRFPEYYPPKPSVDPSKTLDHFHILLNLPLELVGLIASQCAPADGVCLSLTS